MSPENIEISASEARSKFAYLFSSVAELYRFYYGKKPSTKFDDIKSAVEKLNSDEKLGEYLFENLSCAFDKYPTLLPGVVVQNYKINAKEEQERLNKLGKFLDILIGDICGEISDKVKENDVQEKESLNRWLNNK